MVVALYDDEGVPVTSIDASDLTDNATKVQYLRDGGTWVDGASATLKTLGATHVDGGIANLAGGAAWLVDMPDAAFADGAGSVAARLHPLPTGVAECSPGVRMIDAAVSGVPAATWSAGNRTLTGFDFPVGTGAGDHLLTVNVTSTGGNVSGATITVQTSAGVRHAVVQTDVNGQATVGVSDDIYALIVKATGYDSITDAVEVDGDNATKLITLTATATAEPAPAGFTNVPYLATDADGQPLAGVEITATITRTAHDDVGHAYAKTQTRTTDAAGVATLILPHNSTADVEAGDVRESVTVQAEASTAVRSIVIAT
ncbi:MAG: hypothetical protein AAGD32_05285 [Planctomycetota bacterium]